MSQWFAPVASSWLQNTGVSSRASVAHDRPAVENIANRLREARLPLRSRKRLRFPLPGVRDPREEVCLMSPADRACRTPSSKACQPVGAPAGGWGLDILYMAGFPEGVGAARVGEDVREPLRLTVERAADREADAAVLCPLPRVDEIEDGVDKLSQAFYFEQSRMGPGVRMAVLEWVFGRHRRSGC